MKDSKLYVDPKTTCVIADFDGTIIKKMVHGQLVPSLASQLVDEQYIGKQGVSEVNRLVNYYYPFEIDHALSNQEKSRYMQEWWEKSYNILLRYKITKPMIEAICSSPMIQLRDGVPDFFTYLHKYQIPLIIFSGSLIGYDSIQILLRKYQLLTPNISFFSNDLIFDRRGSFKKIKTPIIHSANKTGTTLVNNRYLTNPPQQKHCLLIGDSLDDVLMSEGIMFNKVIKVAFAPQNKSQFTKMFDLVLPLEASFKPIQSLFN